MRATVCRHCGERYLPVDSVRTLEQVRRELAEGKLACYRTLGRVVAPQLDPSG